MNDIVDKDTRSRIMSGIKAKNTKPEILVRSLLHKDGFRFRIHVKELPGKPDLVFRKYNAVMFIHGCFWHRHDCKYFKWPKSRIEFWKDKLNKNSENDKKNLQKLLDSGWRVCVIWECSIREAKNDYSPLKEKIEKWLKSNSVFLEVRA